MFCQKKVEIINNNNNINNFFLKKISTSRNHYSAFKKTNYNSPRKYTKKSKSRMGSMNRTVCGPDSRTSTKWLPANSR